MTPQEQEEFTRASQEILLAQADGLCRINIGTDPNGGTPRIVSRNTARGTRAQDIDKALDIARHALEQGKATVDNTGAAKTPRLVPAEITTKHFYPVAYMTNEEETRFHQAVAEINQDLATRQCSFESDLDEEARVYFRYSVSDAADDPHRVLANIHLVINHVHWSRALRMEIPGGGVMITPRWRLIEETSNPQAETA